MKNLKANLFIGFIFVSILGTLAHFFYKWSANNFLVGLFTPVNESTWEHMKLLFFPALIYLPITKHYLAGKYPNISYAFAYGIIVGTLSIPIIFYTYSGILGFTITPLDISTFFISVALAFIIIYLLAKNHIKLGDTGLILLVIFAIAFMLFSYNAPDLGIFKDVEMSP